MPRPAQVDEFLIWKEYQEGCSQAELQRKHRIGKGRLGRLIADVRRSLSEQCALRYDKHRGVNLSDISATTWRELYWAPDKPGMSLLAERFHCSPTTIRRYLDFHGIKRRTPGQQKAADIVAGRITLVKGLSGERAAAHMRAISQGWHPGLISEAAKKKSAAKRRCRIPVRCWWCGRQFERWPCQMKGQTRTYCGVACMGAGQYHPDTLARPLLLRALRDAVPAGIRYRDLTPIAARLGADRREIRALWSELHPRTPLMEQDLGSLGLQILGIAKQGQS